MEALIYVHCEGKTRLSTIRRPAVCHPKQLRAKQWSTLATRASTKRTKTEQSRAEEGKGTRERVSVLSPSRRLRDLAEVPCLNLVSVVLGR